MEEIYGPHQTEAEAHAAVMRMTGPGELPVPSVLSPQQKWQLLSDACEASALELGAHDTRFLSWQADYTDSTLAVLAGLILRASRQGHVPVSVPAPGIERAVALGRWMTADPELDWPTRPGVDRTARHHRRARPGPGHPRAGALAGRPSDE